MKHLRPARETCEQCHWPEKFHGDKFLVRTKYADDEANTASTTVLVLKIGGAQRPATPSASTAPTSIPSGRSTTSPPTDAAR